MKKKKEFLSHYNTFFCKIYRYVFFRTGRNKELAEDMTSDIFLKAYEAFEDFDETKNFSVWIYRIAHNHLIDHYRKLKGEPIPLEEVINELKSEALHMQDLDRKIHLKHVADLLGKLPENQREVMVMKYFSDLTNKEISQILNMNEAHVRVLQHRALDFLKTRLAFLAS